MEVTMEEVLKLVEILKEEAPQAKVKFDSLTVTHYFTVKELLNICNKYADVVGQSEQECPNCEGKGFTGNPTDEIVVPCLGCFGRGKVHPLEENNTDDRFPHPRIVYRENQLRNKKNGE